MTGDGSFFPDPPGSQYSSHNAKSILNYHPVLEFNGNKNDFWLLFDDSDILEKHQSRPLRKPPKPSDDPASSSKPKEATSKPGFTNTFTDATSSKSGFLLLKDDDELSQKSDNSTSKNRFADGPEGRQARLDRLTRSGRDPLPRKKEAVRERRRSRSHERLRPHSRERGRSRSLDRHRSRSPDRRRSPVRDRHFGGRRGLYSGRRRSRSREARGRDRSRSKDRLQRSKDRERKRVSPSSSRKGSRSKRSVSVSSNSSNSGIRSEADKAGKAELLKKFAEKLQEKANTSLTAKKSLSSVRLNSRLEDTKHRRAEAITPIVFSLKKAPVKSFSATTLPQKMEDKEKADLELPKEKSAEPMEISEPPQEVSSIINIPIPTDIQYTVPPPLIPERRQDSQQAQPLRVTDGVTVACAPTLYKDGKKAPVSSAIIALPPSSKPSQTVVSQSNPVIAQTSPVTTQFPPLTSLPLPKMSQPMEPPVINEMQQNLAALAMGYAAISQAQDLVLPGQVVQTGFDQQNMGIPPPGFRPVMRVPPGPPPGPPPGHPRPGHGIRPGMMIRGPHPGMMGPRHFGPQGQFMGPHGPEGPFMAPHPHGPEGPFMGPPPHGPDGPFMGPPPHGPDGPFMGPPPHGPDGPFMGPPDGPFMGPPDGPFMGPPDGPFMGPPPHGPDGSFMGPPPHGLEGPFMGPPPHGPEGHFMGPPPHGPEGPFMGPPPHGPDGPFMGPPPHGPEAPFMGSPGPGMRSPFLEPQTGPIGPPPLKIIRSSSQNTNSTTVSQQPSKSVTATPKADVKTYSSVIPSPSVEEKGKPTSSVIEKTIPSSSQVEKVKTADSTAEKGRTNSSTPDRKRTPSKPALPSLDIPNFEKVKFMVGLIEFLQNRSDLKKYITALEKNPSEEHCIKNGLLCKVKREPEYGVPVIVVPEDGNARRTIVTAFVLKYPDLDVDALIELFEQTFLNMPMEDIEDVLEDESTRSSTLLKSTDADFSKVESISSCGKIVLQGESVRDVNPDKARFSGKSEKKEKPKSGESSNKNLKMEKQKIGEIFDKNVTMLKSKIAESSDKKVKEEEVKAHSNEKSEKKATDTSKDTGKTSAATKENSKTPVLKDNVSVASSAELKASSGKPQASKKSETAKSKDASEKLQSSSGKAESPVTKVEETPEKPQAANQSETSESSIPLESSKDSSNEKVNLPIVSKTCDMNAASTPKEETSASTSEVEAGAHAVKSCTETENAVQGSEQRIEEKVVVSLTEDDISKKSDFDSVAKECTILHKEATIDDLKSACSEIITNDHVLKATSEKLEAPKKSVTAKFADASEKLQSSSGKAVSPVTKIEETREKPQAPNQSETSMSSVPSERSKDSSNKKVGSPIVSKTSDMNDASSPKEETSASTSEVEAGAHTVKSCTETEKAVQGSEQGIEEKVAICLTEDDIPKKSDCDGVAKEDAVLCKESTIGDLKSACSEIITNDGILKATSEKLEAPEKSGTAKFADASEKLWSSSGKAVSPVTKIEETPEKPQAPNQSETSMSSVRLESCKDSSDRKFELPIVSKTSDMKAPSTPREETSESASEVLAHPVESRTETDEAVQQSEQEIEENVASSLTEDDISKKCECDSVSKEGTILSKKAAIAELESACSKIITNDGEESDKITGTSDPADISLDTAKDLHVLLKESVDVQDSEGKSSKRADVHNPKDGIKETDSEISANDGIVEFKSVEEIAEAQSSQPQPSKFDSLETPSDNAVVSEFSSAHPKSEEPSTIIEVPSTEKSNPGPSSVDASKKERTPCTSEKVRDSVTLMVAEDHKQADRKVVETNAEPLKEVTNEENSGKPVESSSVSIETPTSDGKTPESSVEKELVVAPENVDGRSSEVLAQTAQGHTEAKIHTAAESGSKDTEPFESQSPDLDQLKLSDTEVHSEKTSAQNNLLAVTSSTSGLEITSDSKEPSTVSGDEATILVKVGLVTREIEISVGSDEAKTESGIPSPFLEKETKTLPESVAAKEIQPVEEAKKVEPMKVDAETPRSAPVAIDEPSKPPNHLESSTAELKVIVSDKAVSTPPKALEPKLTEQSTPEDKLADPAQDEIIIKKPEEPRTRRTQGPASVGKSVYEAGTISKASGDTDSGAKTKSLEVKEPTVVPETQASQALPAELPNTQNRDGKNDNKDKPIIEGGPKVATISSNVADGTTPTQSQVSKVPNKPGSTKETSAADVQQENHSSDSVKLPPAAKLESSEDSLKQQDTHDSQQFTNVMPDLQNSSKSVAQKPENRITTENTEESIKSTPGSELLVLPDDAKPSDTQSPVPTPSEVSEVKIQPEPMETSVIPVVKEEIKTEDTANLDPEEDSISEQSTNAGSIGALDTGETTGQSESKIQPRSSTSITNYTTASKAYASPEECGCGNTTENSNDEPTADNVVIKTDEVREKIKQEPEIELGTPTQVEEEPTTTEIDVVKSEKVPATKTPPPKQKFSKYKSTYELMKSMDLGKPKELYNEPDALTIVNYEKLSFFTPRLKEIQKYSDVALLTSKMVFIPYDTTDQFVMKNGLLCKQKDLQKSDVFIVLLKSTVVYREIVSALTEQYPDLEFNEFMSLIDSSFMYITPAEINSLAETIDQKIVSMNYRTFIERCNIVNYDIILAGTMLEQLRTMQKADNAILHRYNRLRATSGVDDSYILKYDLVCQFVGTIDFKVWLPNSQPDQIAIMYIVHETNHDQDLVKFLELLRDTFEGVNASLIDKPIALCSVCHPPATANASSIVKACEQKCAALKFLPPEVVYKIRQIQMTSSVYKAQIDLLTKGQSRQGSRYILDTSLLCKAMTKGSEQVFRVVISPSGLKEVISLLHTTYHRKPLDEFVSFVNEFLAVTKEVCSAAFKECYLCMKSKSPKMSVDTQKPQLKAIGTSIALDKSSDSPKEEKQEHSKKETKGSSKDSPKTFVDTQKPQSKANDTPKPLEKKFSEFAKEESKEPSKKDTTVSSKDGSKVPTGKNSKPNEQESTKVASKGTPNLTSTFKDSKYTEPESSKTMWEAREKATPPPKTARGEKIRRDVMRDLRANERIWGRELGDRVRHMLRIVPDRILSDIISSQRSCPELMRTIKALDQTRPIKDAKEMLCGGILFVLKSKMKPKIAVKPIKHINYLLITKIHSEIHDWNVNKIHGTIGIAFDVSPSKEEVEGTINWFCHRCIKPETKKKEKIYSSLDEKLKDFYSTIEPVLNKARAPKESGEVLLGNKTKSKETETQDDEMSKEIGKDLLKLDEVWGKELGEKIKAVSQPIPETVLKAVVTAQRECSDLMEIIEQLETSTPVKDARHVLCGGVLYIVKSKKKAMLVKICVKPIKNINYILINNLHAACHHWTVNRLQTVIGVSFDVSPTREEVAVTIEWFCAQCQKPDTSSKNKKTAASLEDQLKDLYDTIDPSLLKPKDDDDDQEATIDLTQEIPVTDVRDALAKLPSPVVSKIQLAQMQSNVLNTQIKLLENTDGPGKDKGYHLVMSLLCKLVELDGKLAWRVMIPSDMLKELVVELHTVHYHDMIQEDFSEFVNMFMTVPEGMINELFASCAWCLTTVRRVPTLCERGINEDILRKTLATIAEMIEFIIKWQTECPAIVKIREGVKRCRQEAIAEHILYKDILFKLCGKSKGGKGPRPKIAVSLLSNAMDEVIKSTHAFYHSNNPNQLMNLINTTFDVTVPRNLLVTKIPELCNICRKKTEKSQLGRDANIAAGASTAVESKNSGSVVKEESKEPDEGASSGVDSATGFVVKEEVNLPIEITTDEEPTPLGVLLLGRLCDQVIEESSNSSRALDSPVPDMTSTDAEPSPVIRRSCKILLERCKYDPDIVQEISEITAKKRKKETQKPPAKRGRKPKNLPKIDDPESIDESESGSESTLAKRKFVVYSSESETDDSTSKKRKATTGSSQKPKRTKK